MTLDQAKTIARATEATGDKRTLLKMAHDSASVLAKEVDRLQEENERLKANDFVTCANCECYVPRSATKLNAEGKPICIDNAVRSACGHMVLIERLKETLRMVLDGEVEVFHRERTYDTSVNGYWCNYQGKEVGPYPTRLDAVLALADELGL